METDVDSDDRDTETETDRKRREKKGRWMPGKRSRVYAFVYRAAYGGSMCRATKTRATSYNGFYAALV